MKNELVQFLGVVTMSGAFVLAGCTPKSDPGSTAEPGVGERTGAALDRAADKTAETAKAAAEKTEAAADKAVEKTGEALEKSGAAIEKTGADLQK